MEVFLRCHYIPAGKRRLNFLLSKDCKDIHRDSPREELLRRLGRV